MFEIMVCFCGISTIAVYSMPNPFVYIETVLFQTIQFNLSTQFRSIDRIRVLSIDPLRARVDMGAMAFSYSSITGSSSSGSLVSYPGYALGGSYSSAVMQSVYSAAPVDWTSLR